MHIKKSIMKGLNFLKGLWPDKEPKPLSVLEKAKTRCKTTHGFYHIRYNLQKQVKSISGFIEENGERKGVIWDALGSAYVNGSRRRSFDLLITEPYKDVCR